MNGAVPLAMTNSAGMYWVMAALVGLLGILAGWLWGRSRPVAADNRLADELRQQVAQREAELAKLRSQLGEATAARAAAEANCAASKEMAASQREYHEKAQREAQATQEKALGELRAAFKALSADTLRELQPAFIDRVTETVAKLQESAKGDLAQRQEAIKTLVKPLEEQLRTYQQRLQQSEATQSSALGEVKKHLETLAQQSQSLSSETLQLRRVLSSSQARGRWGEETLRRVVEAAGMSAHCDFSEQTRSGDTKPDLVVRLPGDRLIIIDAKVPDLDFLQAMDAADETTRTEALQAHAAKLKATVRSLAEKDYPGKFANALDYVVLFLPAESLFSAALEGDHDLIVWAASKHILLATPASLIALLRSVSVCWQQQAQTENALAISGAAQELYTRVRTFTEHFESLRKGLDSANQAFNNAIGSYERRVRPIGEQLRKLGGAGNNGKELADVLPLDNNLRLPL
jgi:DNA recombination protein RmuC